MRSEDASARHPSTSRSPAGLAGLRRRRWLLVGGVVVGVALVTGLLGYGLTRDPNAIATPLIGRPAPNIILRSLEGERFELFSLRGRPVVVNFWASWCKPCVGEHAVLSAGWERYRDRGLVLLGIVYQDSATNARSFRDRFGGDWPVLLDPSAEAALAYGVYGIPETFFIRPDGRVSFKIAGELSYTVMTKQVSRLFEDTTP